MSTLVLLPREVCRAECGLERTYCGGAIVRGRPYAMGDRFDCSRCRRREAEMLAAVEAKGAGS